MLQNRVDPYGRLIFTHARGAWMGNRGILHDEQQQILRPFKLKAWITCVLQFRGRYRKVMAPNRYTELFFRDEATSFAAGHRPCYECRRADYNRFKSYWLKGNPEYGFEEGVSIQEIDQILHRERMTPRREKVTYTDTLHKLPDGCFVLYEQQPCLVYEQALYIWSPEGYSKIDGFPKEELIQILTPRSVVNAFRAGYRPQVLIS